jgi:magnesium-transporting ATPase (P-type)
MLRSPRKVNQPLVDRPLLGRALLWLGAIEALLCYAGFFFVYDWVDHPLWKQVVLSIGLDLSIPADQRYSLAVTVFYAGVVMAQVGNAFACRTERNRGRSLGWLSNPVLLLGIAADLLMLFVLVYLPPVARMFGHAPLPPLLWVGLATFPVLLYSLDWLRKGFTRWQVRIKKEAV